MERKNTVSMQAMAAPTRKVSFTAGNVADLWKS